MYYFLRNKSHLLGGKLSFAECLHDCQWHLVVSREDQLVLLVLQSTSTKKILNKVFADITQEPKSLGKDGHIQEYEAGDYLMKQVSKTNPGVVLSSTHACTDTDMPAFMYTCAHTQDLVVQA